MGDEFVGDRSEDWDRRRRQLEAHAEHLGERAAHDQMVRQAVLPNLLQGVNEFAAFAFGRGLAREVEDPKALWAELLVVLGDVEGECPSSAIMRGVLDVINEKDTDLSASLLDEAVQNPVVRKIFMDLQRLVPIDARGLCRLRECLAYDDVAIHSFECLGWARPFATLSEKTLGELLLEVVAKPDGANVALHCLSMRFYKIEKDGGIPGPELARVGLVVAAQVIRGWGAGNGRPEHELRWVLKVCLRPDELPDASHDVLAALMDRVKASYGFLLGLDEALRVTAARMPRSFLDALFYDPDIKDYMRSNLVRENEIGSGPLTDISSEDLLSWVREENPDERIIKVAGAISPLEKVSDGRQPKLSNQALTLIHEARNPHDVITALYRGDGPTMVWGRNTDAFAKQRAAFAELAQAEDARVREAARKVIENLEQAEERAQDIDREFDRLREQTFE